MSSSKPVLRSVPTKRCKSSRGQSSAKLKTASVPLCRAPNNGTAAPLLGMGPRTGSVLCNEIDGLDAAFVNLDADA